MTREGDYPMIAVRWLDSVTCQHGGWVDKQDIADTLEASGLMHISVGYLIGESHSAIQLAQSVNDTTSTEVTFAGVLVIPVGSIVYRHNLDYAAAA